MKYDKPFLDYGERIEKLKVDYNLEITTEPPTTKVAGF